MEVALIKTPQGAFIPATEDEAEKMRRFRVGEVVRVDAAQMRNGRFFRKWWALAKVAFDAWVECAPRVEFQGETVLPDFEVFRRNLTVLAGFYRPVFNVKGELRMEPESLKWSKMDETRFDQLYNATINAVLEKILPKGRFTEDELRETVERVMRFT